MHPEIKKFWESEGYSISNEDQKMTGTVSGYKSIKVDADSQYAIISKIETLAFGDRYRWPSNGQWYSEEEMLRIIKQKAFL